MKSFYRMPASRIFKGISMLLFLLILTASIKAQEFYEQPKMNSAQEFRNNGYKKVGVALRHHGRRQCTCPGGCVCPACACPIGLCICIDLRPVTLDDDQGLTQDQINNLYGIVWVKIVGTELHVIFESPNDENGIMTIDTSPVADMTDASKFGVSSSFQIENGEYTLVKNKYAYGEIVLRISFL